MLNLKIIQSAAPEEPKKEESTLSLSLFLMVITLSFVLFGLIMLFSTSSGNSSSQELSLMGFEVSLFFIKQAMWAIIGMGGATTIYLIGFERLSKYSTFLLIFAVFALIAALFFPEINGARRWIRLPWMSIQPSELAKIIIVIYLAQFLAKKQRFIDSIPSMVPALSWFIVIISLIICGEDLGTTLLLAATVWLMFFVAGMKLRWLIALPAMVVPLGSLYIIFWDPMRLSRLLSFLDPEAVHEKSGYQLWNSLLALGSGSWSGLGFGESRMKAMYLPEAHTDFILSIVGEELGFLSITFVILGYVGITALGVWISIRAKNNALMFMGVGATSLITLQAIINLGVVSGGLPTKGMPAPFISYGGSNMFMCLCCIGLLLCIEKENKQE